MTASTIGSINLLPEDEKFATYARIVPNALFQRFNIRPDDRLLWQFRYAPGSGDVEMSLFHEAGFPDPILYGHLTDTISGQIHVLLYVLNDPTSERCNVDTMPDGNATRFGTARRNLPEEVKSMHAGRAPGQVRAGLKLLGAAIESFEMFVSSLGHDMYFVEPLYYHNAIIFERYGFAYQMGKRFMERIEQGFGEGGDLRARLDGASPFRENRAAESIRLRSWAIHDGILGEPFSYVTMYKRVGKHAGLNTCPRCRW
jgi:hypothetical protein